jgi:hypothetical protein
MAVPAAVRQLLQKERQVPLLRKPRQLPAGVEPDIQEQLHVIVFEQPKELLGTLLGKADCVENHEQQVSGRGKSGFCASPQRLAQAQLTTL